MNCSKAEKSLVIFDILQSTLATIREAGPAGAPASMIYLALASHGCSLANFNRLMAILLDSGKVRFGADCRYFAQ